MSGPIPITVRGDVDERAVEQLRRCAQAGGATAGVLCADGHAVLGECAWIGVRSVTAAGRAQTFDVITGDPQQAFVAGGITVHNCGNTAVRTDQLTTDVAPGLPRVMDEIFARISFGVGQRNDEPVDHPVIDGIGEAEFAGQRALKDLAAK